MTPLPIDQAYAEINSLGGTVEPEDTTGRECMALLDAVLRIMERHGAMDPELRPASDEADDLRAASAISTNHARIVSLTGGVHG